MPPLLSVGIPAYDRPESLERAVRSVLGQTLADLEVVVSDDASPDPEVARVGERLAREDERVRFACQPRNLGHARNYRWVAEAARGEHFMWLSDDDWIDPGYASRCIEELEADPRRRLVCGQARYYSNGEWIADERPIDLTARRAGARVAGFYARVSMNGPLFGVARRADVLEIPFEEVPAGDWLLVAAFAARGEVRTLRDVHVHRSADGLGGDEERLARSFGFRGARARWYHVWVAGAVWRGIVRGGPGQPLARLATATLAATAILVRFPAVKLLRTLGLGAVEQRVVAWARTRRR
jgi:glycosyltransferase involved in cell wall biosynthesis